jgi:hypothetical protein
MAARSSWVGHEVDEGAERGDARHAVGDRVVHLHEQADAPVRQPGQEP